MSPCALVAAVAHGPEAASASEMRWLRDALAVDRTVGYLAMATLIGGWVFLAVVWPDGAGVRRTRRLLTVAWITGLLATLVGLGLVGAIVHGSGFGGVVDGGVISDVLETDPGRAWMSRAMMLLLALPLLGALARDQEHAARALWWRLGVLVVSAGLVRTRGFVGHSMETDHSALDSAANFVHISAIATWLGGLILLAFVVLPRRDPRELAVVLPRYSKVALYAVGVLVLAGVVLSWIIVGGWDDLFGTRYGRVLLIKLVIFTGLMGVAGVSKRWVDTRLRLAVVGGGEMVSLRAIVVPVLTEVAFAVALMGISAGLVSASPGT
jgi:copper transport protein